MEVSLTTLLIVAAAVVLLLARYWTGSHSTQVDHSNLRASPPRAPENSNEFLLNRAYRCFAFLGLLILPLGFAALQQAFGIDFDKDSGFFSRGVGQTLFRLGYFVSLFLSVPIFAGMLYATIYGIRQTVRFRHPALVALSVVSIVFWGGTMIYIPMYSDVPGHPYLEYAWDIAFGVYIAANLLIPAWWFTKGRRRYRSKAQ
jgi:hypothetical protein